MAAPWRTLPRLGPLKRCKALQVYAPRPGARSLDERAVEET